MVAKEPGPEGQLAQPKETCTTGTAGSTHEQDPGCGDDLDSITPGAWASTPTPPQQGTPEPAASSTTGTIGADVRPSEANTKPTLTCEYCQESVYIVHCLDCRTPVCLAKCWDHCANSCNRCAAAPFQNNSAQEAPAVRLPPTRAGTSKVIGSACRNLIDGGAPASNVNSTGSTAFEAEHIVAEVSAIAAPGPSSVAHDCKGECSSEAQERHTYGRETAETVLVGTGSAPESPPTPALLSGGGER